MSTPRSSSTFRRIRCGKRRSGGSAPTPPRCRPAPGFTEGGPGRPRLHMQRLMRTQQTIALAILVAWLLPACRGAQQETTASQPDPQASGDVQNLETMAARFAPVDLTADVSGLPANER